MSKKRIGFAVWIFALITGLFLLLYPTLSNAYNQLHATQIIQSYAQSMQNLSTKQKEQMLEEVSAYNESLLFDAGRFDPDSSHSELYNSLLSYDSHGLMGTLSIPAISLSLPIYHGTGTYALSTGVGHVEGSSLPGTGKGSHTVLSGHRGLPSAALFSDLDQLQIGDTFEIQVLDQSCTYEVDQIRIVLPQEMEDLAIDPEQDYVTLVTCTPYGVNTHRLLVRGHRVYNMEESENLISEAIVLDYRLVSVFIAIPLILVLILSLVKKPERKKR